MRARWTHEDDAGKVAPSIFGQCPLTNFSGGGTLIPTSLLEDLVLNPIQQGFQPWHSRHRLVAGGVPSGARQLRGPRGGLRVLNPG